MTGLLVGKGLLQKSPANSQACASDMHADASDKHTGDEMGATTVPKHARICRRHTYSLHDAKILQLHTLPDARFDATNDLKQKELKALADWQLSS